MADGAEDDDKPGAGKCKPPPETTAEEKAEAARIAAAVALSADAIAAIRAIVTPPSDTLEMQREMQRGRQIIDRDPTLQKLGKIERAIAALSAPASAANKPPIADAHQEKPLEKNLGGRPSPKDLVLAEARRQIDAGIQIPATAGGWGNNMAQWLARHPDKPPVVRPKTCTRYLSDLHREAKARNLINPGN